jgi:micrococcal nuclease
MGKYRNFPAIYILVGLLTLSVSLNLIQFLKFPKNDQGILVIGVIDGDTLVLDGKVKVRLRHIDAPELDFCGGKEAKDNLAKLVLNQKVRLAEQIPDQYGRSMALIYKGNDLINLLMLENGWAIYHSDTTSQEDQLKSAAIAAKTNQLGVYGLCQSTDKPDKPGCLIKGNIDKNSGAQNYYLPNCAQYKFTIVEKNIGENWFCTEKEAVKAGFTKAKTCN